MKNMKISERYTFRGKWRDELTKDTKWIYGLLKWDEIMPSPIRSKEETNRDINIYSILKRRDMAPDWNLPYSYVTYWIPEEFYDTITPYTGWNDVNGDKIFVGDIVRFEDDLAKNDYIVTDYGIMDQYHGLQSFVHFFYDSATHNLTHFKIIGNKWDGPKSSPRFKYEFSEWINEELKQGK